MLLSMQPAPGAAVATSRHGRRRGSGPCPQSSPMLEELGGDWQSPGLQGERGATRHVGLALGW